MNFRGSRFYLLIPFLVLALSQIMCDTVMKEEETVKLAEELLGLEIGEGLVYDVDVEVVLPNQKVCSQLKYEIPQGQIQSYEFGKEGSGDTLTVVNPDGKFEYKGAHPIYERVDVQDPDITYRIVFSDTGIGYTYTVLHQPYTPVLYFCYRAINNLTLTNEEMPGGEVVQDESAPPPDENVADDPSTDPKPVEEAEQIEEQSQVEESVEPEQDTLEYDISSCLPTKGHDFTLEIIDLTDRSSDIKRHCNAKGVITNTSDQKLMFSAYRVHNYGGQKYEKWMRAGYQSVEPGETVEYAEFYWCTGGNCGDGTWYYYKYISILYNTPECLQIVFAEEEKIPESIVEIENPCDW